MEDLDLGSELKNWMLLETEGLLENTEGLEDMIEDSKIGIEDLAGLEGWVWVDWSLDELTPAPCPLPL